MQNLDLSKFPHIVKPSEMEDLEMIKKRQDELEQIKIIAENLISSINAYLLDLSSFDSKAKLLNQREYNLKDAEYELAEKEKKVYALEADINKEKEYIGRANIELKQRESDMLGNKDYLSEIEKSKLEWEEKKAEVIKQEAIIEEKLKLQKANQVQKEADEQALEDRRVQLEELNRIRQNEIDARAKLIAKREDIDTDRKRLLDLRETRIKNKESRLNLDQEE